MLTCGQMCDSTTDNLPRMNTHSNKKPDGAFSEQSYVLFQMNLINSFGQQPVFFWMSFST